MGRDNGRDGVCWLIGITYEKDSLRQRIGREKRQKVFCRIASVGASEFFSAGRNGMKAQYKVTVSGADYGGEPIVELDGVRYSVYRTYLNEEWNWELYLKQEAGTG